MMVQNKNNSGKAVEIRSKEVQEVMNRIPSAIVRWGMTLMVFIVTGILIASAYIRWPETIECPFELDRDGGIFYITTTLPPKAVKYISSESNCDVSLYSPMFPGEYSEIGVSGYIRELTLMDIQEDSYRVLLYIDLPNDSIRQRMGQKMFGNLSISISNGTILQYLFHHIYP